MTMRQQAYGLIDRLSDDSVQLVIQVMKKMLPHDRENKAAITPVDSETSAKMRAYLRMQELRKETAHYDVSETQRAAAIDEKFGTID